MYWPRAVPTSSRAAGNMRKSLLAIGLSPERRKAVLKLCGTSFDLKWLIPRSSILDLGVMTMRQILGAAVNGGLVSAIGAYIGIKVGLCKAATGAIPSRGDTEEGVL